MSTPIRTPQLVSLGGRAPAILRQVVADLGFPILGDRPDALLVALAPAEAAHLEGLGATVVPAPPPGPPDAGAPHAE